MPSPAARAAVRFSECRETDAAPLSYTGLAFLPLNLVLCSSEGVVYHPSHALRRLIGARTHAKAKLHDDWLESVSLQADG